MWNSFINLVFFCVAYGVSSRAKWKESWACSKPWDPRECPVIIIPLPSWSTSVTTWSTVRSDQVRDWIEKASRKVRPWLLDRYRQNIIVNSFLIASVLWKFEIDDGGVMSWRKTNFPLVWWIAFSCALMNGFLSLCLVEILSRSITFSSTLCLLN